MSSPAKRTVPRIGREHAGELADQRGFAGAVRPDDGVQLALLHVERDVVGGENAAEALGQAFDLRAAFQPSARLPLRKPSMPPRANSTTSSSSGPSTICQYSDGRDARE